MAKKDLVRKAAWIILLIFLFLIPIITSETYTLHIFCFIAFQVIFASSLRLVLSVGELSLAHAAFMGIGAYTSALVSIKLNLSFWLALPMAGVVSMVIALPIGYISLRLRGAYFLMLTFAFAEIIRMLLSNFWIGFFGGIPGITNIPSPSIIIPGFLRIDFMSKAHYYYLALVLTLLTIFTMQRIEKSRIGMVFNAIKEADILAEAVGINRMRQKVLAFTIGCFFAGIAGSFYAHFIHIITPHDFALHALMLPAAYMIIGGMSSVAGPVVGTVVLMLLSHFFLRQFGFYEMLIYGILTVVFILLMPQGLIGLPRQVSLLLSRLGGRMRAQDKNNGIARN